MRNWLVMITLTLAAPLLPAQEELPDRAPMEDENEAAMAERFAAPVMGSEEMESLYLESPALVDNPEEQGMSALSDKDRFLESDPLFQEQLRQSQDTITIQTPDDPVDPPPPPPSFFEPVRQL